MAWLILNRDQVLYDSEPVQSSGHSWCKCDAPADFSLNYVTFGTGMIFKLFQCPEKSLLDKASLQNTIECEAFKCVILICQKYSFNILKMLTFPLGTQMTTITWFLAPTKQPQRTSSEVILMMIVMLRNQALLLLQQPLHRFVLFGCEGKIFTITKIFWCIIWHVL